MRTALGELRYAVRRLRGSPVFTIAATLTLAIAIGATASVFSLVDGVLLKAFPYRAADRVLTIWDSSPVHRQPLTSVATGNYFDYLAHSTSFSKIAGATVDAMQFTVLGASDAERVWGEAVTSNYFAALGITPILGRPLSGDTSSAEVVISYGYWQRRFGSSPTALGQKLHIDNGNDQRPTPRYTYTIVGVMPPDLPGRIELWVQIFFEPGEQTDRADRYMNVWGRLKPGVSPAAAQRELETIAGRAAQDFPKTNEGWSARTIPLIDHLVGPVRPALLMLLASAGCVLLIGAANLANLFLVRSSVRQRELALRTALGATQGRVIRELVAEAAILGLGAGTLGVGVAVAGVRMLRALAPPTLPRLSQIGVDGRVVAFCAAASLISVLVFGLLPAWQVSRGNLAEVLKEGGRGTGSAQHHRLQDGLVILQVAVALILLTGAGLLVASFQHFRRMDPGIRPDGVLTAQIALGHDRYPTSQQVNAFLARVPEQLEAQPGIEAATVSSWLPGAFITYGGSPFNILGDPGADPAHTPVSTRVLIDSHYFRALGIPVRRGRGFLATDDSRSVNVAVVDELLARRFFSGRDPIGRRLSFARGWDTDTVEIVGVVGNVKQYGLAVDNTPVIYVPFAQLIGDRFVKNGSGAYVSVRTADDPVAATELVKRTIAGLDPLVAFYHVETLRERLVQSVGTTRFSSFLASLFAVVALTLGIVGVYSVLAYIVSQRQREIAVRIALGARSKDVIRDVLQKALVLCGEGILLGSFTAWILTRALSGLFLGVSPHDPSVFVGAAAAFALVALAAASVPAFRTTRVNPVVALTSN